MPAAHSTGACLWCKWVVAPALLGSSFPADLNSFDRCKTAGTLCLRQVLALQAQLWICLLVSTLTPLFWLPHASCTNVCSMSAWACPATTRCTRRCSQGTSPMLMHQDWAWRACFSRWAAPHAAAVRLWCLHGQFLRVGCGCRQGSVEKQVLVGITRQPTASCTTFVSRALPVGMHSALSRD